MNSPDSPSIRPRNPFERRTHEQIASGKPRPIGGTFRTLPGNTSFDTGARRERRALRPLECHSVPGDSGGVTVQVHPSTVLGVVPTIGGTPLNAETPPELSIPGDTTRHIVLNLRVQATITDGFVFPAIGFEEGEDAVSLTVEETAPSISDLVVTATGSTLIFKTLLATYADGKKNLQAGYGAISGELCDTLEGASKAALVLHWSS